MSELKCYESLGDVNLFNCTPLHVQSIINYIEYGYRVNELIFFEVFSLSARYFTFIVIMIINNCYVQQAVVATAIEKFVATQVDFVSSFQFNSIQFNPSIHTQ